MPLWAFVVLAFIKKIAIEKNNMIVRAISLGTVFAAINLANRILFIRSEFLFNSFEEELDVFFVKGVVSREVLFVIG